MIKIRIYQLIFILMWFAPAFGPEEIPPIKATIKNPRHTLFAQPKKTNPQAEQPLKTEITPIQKTADQEITLTKEEVEQLKTETEPDIELNFNNASLQNIVDQISAIFKITFIPDDIVKTPGSQIKPLSDSKISFKTNLPFTKKRAWSFFTTFLELAGWSLIPTNDPHIYRISAITIANRSSLPTFINTPIETLPTTDQHIRYVCFLENSTASQMKILLDKLKSANAQIDSFEPLRAIIITDAAYNVISLLQIIKELDKTTESQTLAVINLKETEASEVVALISTLQKKDEPEAAPWMPKKETTLYYFPKDVTIIPAPRTNSLILVGPEAGVKRIENFILTHIDTELKQIYHPVHIYDLNYAPAKQLAGILNEVVIFGKEPAAGGGGAGGGAGAQTVGEAGGVLGGLKYFGDVFIQAEEQGNRLLVRSNQEDWIHLSKIIAQLDQRQLQVAIEVMIVEITIDRKRQWGIQWQTKNPRTIQGQMTGFFGSKAVISPTTTPTPNSNSLLANLIQLAKIPDAGTTLLTLGKESVYAILGLLDSNTQTRLIANPFIVATNKFTSSVEISEERRAQTEQIIGSSQAAGNESVEAKLKVTITPQINNHGTINLDINVLIEQFTNPIPSGTDPSNANKSTREVQTNANVADKEVIALGGLIKKKKTTSKTKIPILSRIPIIGNLFKNESHEDSESTLVIFMSPTIIKPAEKITNIYTQNKAQFVTGISEAMEKRYETNKTDPIYRWFFKPVDEDYADTINNFVSRGKRNIKTNDTGSQDKAANKNTLMNSVTTERKEKND